MFVDTNLVYDIHTMTAICRIWSALTNKDLVIQNCKIVRIWCNIFRFPRLINLLTSLLIDPHCQPNHLSYHQLITRFSLTYYIISLVYILYSQSHLFQPFSSCSHCHTLKYRFEQKITQSLSRRMILKKCLFMVIICLYVMNLWWCILSSVHYLLTVVMVYINYVCSPYQAL